MSDQPKPAEPERLASPRAALATGSKEAKARFDALALVFSARRTFSADECVDLATWIIEGEVDDV